MDRETGKGADTGIEVETPAGGSAASADTQRRLPAGPQQKPARTRAEVPDDASAEATTQPIAGRPAAGDLKEGAVQSGDPKGALRDAEAQETRLRDAGKHEDDGPESALTIVPRTTPADLTPARRALVRAGDQRLARPAKKELAGTARRSQTSRWEQPPRRLVPVLRPIFPGLATDPRLPIWIARALAATAVGVAVTIWQNWRLGLTAAAAVTILDIIYRSRTTSVIPAAVRVTSAQRRTRRRLALLRGRGYIALNGRAIPGSDSVIDHLVIGPRGRFRAGLGALGSQAAGPHRRFGTAVPRPVRPGGAPGARRLGSSAGQ